MRLGRYGRDRAREGEERVRFALAGISSADIGELHQREGREGREELPLGRTLRVLTHPLQERGEQHQHRGRRGRRGTQRNSNRLEKGVRERDHLPVHATLPSSGSHLISCRCGSQLQWQSSANLCDLCVLCVKACLHPP